MATSLLKLTSIIFLVLALLLPTLCLNFELNDDDDSEEEYILDNPIPSTNMRHKLLAIIKKGTRCDAIKNNICNGVPANKGTGILYCCKKHCRNVLGDRNNCGKCGHKCKFMQRCCGGTCTDIVYNSSHCGKCNKKCKGGQPCDYGVCGYA